MLALYKEVRALSFSSQRANVERFALDNFELLDILHQVFMGSF